LRTAIRPITARPEGRGARREDRGWKLAGDAGAGRGDPPSDGPAFVHIRRYSVKFTDIRPFREKIICAVLADGCEPHGHAFRLPATKHLFFSGQLLKCRNFFL